LPKNSVCFSRPRAERAGETKFESSAQNRFDYYQLLPTRQEMSNFSRGKIRLARPASGRGEPKMKLKNQ